MYVDTDIAAVKLPQVAYSLIQNSGGSAAWNGAFLGLDLGNNLDRDPLFLAPLDPAGAPALGGDLRSAYPAGSLSDSGGSAYHWADELDIDGDGNTSEPTPYDLRGLNRASLTIDIGAYEGGQILFVDQAVSGGAQDGVSWANAFPELAQALAHVQAGGEAQQIWVAAGIYHPEEGSDDGRARQLRAAVQPGDLRRLQRQRDPAGAARPAREPHHPQRRARRPRRPAGQLLSCRHTLLCRQPDAGWLHHPGRQCDARGRSDA
jgi:hypothetical protein